MQRSALYADLGLRGNLRSRFRAVLDIDYEPGYIVFDGPEISWNFRSDVAFDRVLYAAGVAPGIARFLNAMAATSRLLGKVSRMLASSEGRRDRNREDLLADLRAYWGARELHTTNLFMFWNVEHRLAEELTKGALAAGMRDEVETGLPNLLRSGETSFAELERQQRSRLAYRFSEVELSESDGPGATDPLREALRAHWESFGFLLAPFGPPVSADPGESLTRIRETPPDPSSGELSLRVSGGPLDDLPPQLRELALLGRQIAFWKAERIDLLAAADFRIGSLYRDAAATIGLDPDRFLAMTRHEVEAALEGAESVVDEATLDRRRGGYCLVLHDGRIEFFEPSKRQERQRPAAKPGDRLRGRPTSPGSASGRVVVIPDAAAVVRDRSLGERLRNGDILVTRMTRTEMDQVLARAAAWITAEGGSGSHAAILAREMRKPCVTSVEEATEVLRDGMLVTVDGDAGEVTVDAVAEEGGAS